MRIGVVGFFLLLSGISFCGFGQISSTFNANAEGWTAPNPPAADPGIIYNAAGGNPGGHVSAVDAPAGASPPIWYFQAPAAYTGNLSAYYNGTLTFDMARTAGSTALQRADVILSSGTTTIYYFNLSPTTPAIYPAWTTYTVRLNELSGNWKTSNSATGTPATAAQIQFILGNMFTFQIRGRFGSGTLATTRMDNVALTRFLFTTQPVTPVTVCNGATTSFTGAASGVGTITYQWEIFNTTFGGWNVVVNGAGYSGATTGTLTINTTGNFGAGTYRLRALITGANPLYSNTAVLNINPVPAAPTTTGSSACGPASLTLTASGGSAGQYRWYTVATGGTPIAGQTAASYITPVLASTTTYYVAVNNGTCEGTRTAVVATINTIPSAPTTTGASACGSSSVTLTASGGSAGQYRWYTVATGGTAIAGQTNATYTTPVLTGTTTYYVSINNGFCEGARSSVVATINTIPPAPTTTGNSACGSSAITLSASGGSPGEFRWYTVATGGTAIAGQTNGSYTTPVLTLTTTYYVAINNGFCEGARTSVVATINTVPAAPSTTGASACGSASVTLGASGGSAGQYRWYTVSTGGTAIAGQTSASYTTPVLTSTTTYYAALNNGLCEGARTAVVATINTIPAAPTTSGSSACGSSALTLTASGGSAGEYRWYTVSTGGTAIAGQINSSYTTPVLTGTTTYYVALNNGFCEGARASVVATINTIPAAPSTTGASACGSSALTLTASGGSAGQYRWYTVSTGGTAIAGQTNATYTTPVLTGTTTYYVALNNGLCEGARTSVVATINTIPAAPTTTGASACGSSAVTLTATGGSAGQYRWYTVSTGGTAIAGQTNSSYTTPVLTLTTTYYVALNNGLCEGARTAVVATINTIPAAPSTTGASACGSSAVTLTASGGSAGEYRWYTVASGGTAIAGQTNSTYTTPVLTGTTTYYAALNNGFCEGARTSVVATINTIPAAPGTTGNSACGSSAVTLNASGGSPGEYRWYTVSTGGTAIAGQTSNTYTTPVLTFTTTYYVSLNNGLCEGARTAVVATINTIPAAPSTTGASACGSSAVTLNASGGSAGQYRWYTVSTGGTAIAGQTNSTYTTPVLTGTTTYFVALNNGFCEGARTSVVATINTIPAAPSTTGNSACGSSAVTLNASGGSAGEYRWYTVSTGGTAIAGQTSNTYTTPVLTLTTTYYVSLNNGLCEGARTAVVATINTIPASPSTTGASACGSSAVTLNASGGGAGQYRWYTVSTGGTAIAGQTNSAYTTPVLTGTTTYYVALNNGFCEGTRTPVVATINTIPAAPTTTSNSACGSSAVTLNASGGSAGEYRWYTVATGGTAIAGQTNATYTTPVLTSTTTYYVSLNNGLCEGARSSVVATINTVPAAPSTTGASACGSSALTLSASGGAAGEYRWYTVSTGGTAIAGQTNATYTTPVLSGTTTYYVAINNSFCEGARTAVVATINTIPSTPSTTGNSACGPSAVMLTAAGGAAGEYRWYTVASGGTAIAGQTNSTYTTTVLTSTTTYYVSLNNGFCEGARASVVATINTIPSAPSTTGASACGSSALTLTASGGAAGEYRWYTVSTGGTALAGETNSTYNTPVLTGTTSYYVALNNSFCEGARTLVVATINTIPAAPTTTGSGACGSSAITLYASGGSAGQYRWYSVSTGGTAIAGQTNASYTTPVLTVTTTYYVALNNGFCEGARTSVVATISTVPPSPSTTGNSACSASAVTLNASGGSAGEYRWYTVPTGGTAIAGQTNNTYTTPVLTLTTTYYVALNYGSCEGARTSVVATINTIPAAPSTTGASACGPSVLTLNASGGAAGEFRWYTVSTGGTAIAGQTNNAYTTPVLGSTTTYYVALNNGFCEGARTAVVATINMIPSAPSTTGASACGSSAVTLSASGGSSGEYRWYTVPTGGTAIAGQTNGSYTTPVLTGTTTYYVALNNGFCEGVRASVVATINTIPAAPSTTSASACGSAALALGASGGSAGEYRWYTVSTGGTAIAGQTNATYTTPVLTGTTTYYVALNNGFCEGARTSVVATINTIPAAPSTTGNSACGSSALTLMASGGSAGQYRWYTVSTGGTAIAGQTNSSYTTPVITLTTTYHVALNNGLCEGARTAVVATINTIPAAPSTTGASACGSAAVTLSAAGGTAGEYRWYTVASGGTAIAGQTNASYTTPVLTGTTTYYAALNNGFCEGARTSVVATINTIPSAPSTTGNSACGSSAVTLNASGGSAGEFRWYTVSTGGTALAGQTTNTYTTPVLTLTTTYYVALNNGLCEGTRTAVVATINTIPAAPTTTGAAACGSSALTLNGSGGSAGQYRWYTVSTGGTAIAGQTNASYTTPVLTGTTTYFVALNNGFCEGPRTSVVATINTIPAAPSTTGNSACGSSAVTINASGGSAGQYRWYTVSTGGTAIAGQTSNTYTTPVLTLTTTYYVALNNGLCEGARTPVVATINTIPPAPSTTGASACGSSAVALNASGGSAGQYRWYTVSTGGTAIAGQINASYTTPVLTGTTTYYVALNNGFCEGTRTPVVAIINTIPAAPSTTSNSSCGPASITLNASGGSAGQYRWYTVATGGTAIAGQTSNAYITPVLSSTTTYYVSLNNGLCEGSRNPVVATVNSIPSAPSGTGASSCSPSALTLTATGGTAGQYRWHTVSSGGSPIAGQTSASYTTPVISATTTYYVSIDNGTCESARTPVLAQINSPSSTPNTTDGTSCGPGAVTLMAMGGTNGQYRWYAAATGGSPISGEVNDTYLTPTLTLTTIYYVSIDNGVCESNRASVTGFILPILTPPIGVPGTACAPSSTVMLGATGGSNGQYRWYTVSTGGSPISGETNSEYITPIISSATTYYVSINDGMCESQRTPVLAQLISCTPQIETTILATESGGEVTFDLSTLVSTVNNPLDVNSIVVIQQPVSGALATVTAGQLIVDYANITFAGTDRLTIEACDVAAHCAQQEITIEVTGDIKVYNAMSPNGDGKNEILYIQSIDALTATKNNHVTIFDRMGNVVFEVDNYDNVNRVFRGLSTDGSELPAGTYYYKVAFQSGAEAKTGFISLKK